MYFYVEIDLLVAGIEYAFYLEDCLVPTGTHLEILYFHNFLLKIDGFS